MQVGWLGLGAMGAPMAARAARAGHVARGYDIVPGRTVSLAADGVRPAGTAAAAAGGADLIVIMVATPGQMEEALRARRGGRCAGGREHSGGEGDGRARGGHLCRGPSRRGWRGRGRRPVSGGTARAAAGDLLIMVSGPQEPVARVRPMLSALARSAPAVGSSPGDGQRTKLVNQLLCGVHIAAAAGALAFAEALGLTAAECWRVLREGAAASFMLADRGGRMTEGQLEPTRSALDIFAEDTGLAGATAEEAGAAAPLAAAARPLSHSLHTCDQSITLCVLVGGSPGASRPRSTR